MNFIVAVDENWGIGANGDLLVRLSDDMKFFKKTTLGKTVVMGRATFDSLPGRKPLPGRRNIVITRDKNFFAEGVEVCNSAEDVFSLAEKDSSEDFFIIGGEQIYNYFLPYCKKAYITKIHSKFTADKFIPDLDKIENWTKTIESETLSCQGYDFCFTEYENLRPQRSLSSLRSVWLEDEKDMMVILDQTLLPGKKEYIEIKEMKDVWDAIYHLKVRGAPAIGIAAAYGLYIGTKAVLTDSIEELYFELKRIKNYLASARPTAVNLFWALNRMENRFNSVRSLIFGDSEFIENALNSGIIKTLEMDNLSESEKIKILKKALKNEAEEIRKEDEMVCYAIGEHGLSVLKPGWGILTHCNAGTIATSKYGTALAPIYLGNERAYDFKVFADETRPLLQGARLTAWELQEANIDVTLICDNMASIVMQEGKINAVLVGCDRVAANGDTANKIGTSGVAILAKYYNIPFYICAPLSTIDLDCENGSGIHIEERPSEEITDKWYKESMAPKGVKTYNPAFDVTDHELITGIITPNGIAYPPFRETLKIMVEQGV